MTARTYERRGRDDCSGHRQSSGAPGSYCLRMVAGALINFRALDASGFVASRKGAASI